MKNIKFKKFLENNKQGIEQLSQPLQEKIILFERLYDILTDLEQNDKPDILEKLELLDLELLEDIEQEYEDQLEHNERLEELSNSPTIARVLKKDDANPLSSDERLLQRLVSEGKTQNIGRSQLIEMGFKTKLQKSLVLGNYALRRSGVWHYTYDIIPLK